MITEAAALGIGSAAAGVINGIVGSSSNANGFLSFNRIFYNTSQSVDKVGKIPLDDNFMTQTSFDMSYTSYLKPLSDTYSIENLGKDIISVKQQ